MKPIVLWALLAVLAVRPLLAQTVPNRSSLSIEQIMQGDKFVGYLPENIRWSADSRTIYFSWNPDGDTLRQVYQIRIDSIGRTAARTSLAEELSIPADGNFNSDRTRMVYEQYGDLFVLNTQSGEVSRLTNTVDDESDPVFSGDDQQIVYQSGDNLFAHRLSDGQLTQLTQFVKGRERKAAKDADYRERLREEQYELFSVLRERRDLDVARERYGEQREPKRPKAIYLGDQRLTALSTGPDLQHVVYRLTTSADDPATQVPDFLSASGYAEPLRARPKVGGPDDQHKHYIYDRGRDTVYEISFKGLSGIYNKPAYLADYHAQDTSWRDRYEKPKAVVAHGPIWSGDGQAVLVVRSLDNKDRWIARLDLATGQTSVIDHQHDEAWIGGPGIGSNFSTGTLGWLPDNRHLYFQSEAGGYSHLYLAEVGSGEKRALTQGKWEVLDVTLNNKGDQFYLRTNKESPHEQHYYRLPVQGGTLERLTHQKGAYDGVLSPDERYLAARFSQSNQPWELYLIPLGETKTAAREQRLTQSTTPDFRRYDWRQPEIVHFTAADGTQVPARLYRPKGKAKGGPAVIFVHGAGYLQNVHHWWSSYYREYMFHNLLADNGYTVLDIDFRGSAGYGRDWRTAIYRHMGGKDLSDQIDGARYLTRELGVDKDRLAIYGGSYGGFITIMALLQHPGVFQSGAALRSVTDWAHYNHPYTSNILNTPQLDSIAYRRSSPIFFAEGLQDHLLMLHGMVDTNVHFQDVVRLSQRFIELGKDNWELAVFPVEDHAFVEPTSWADEYKRIYKLFFETIGKK